MANIRVGDRFKLLANNWIFRGWHGKEGHVVEVYPSAIVIVIPEHGSAGFSPNHRWTYQMVAVKEGFQFLPHYPDHKCNECQIPIVHFPLEVKMCSTCQLLKEWA